MDVPWWWLAAIGLGVYHGLNPAMGWLFAVSFGLQRRSSRAVIFALGPIVVGHAASVAAFVLLLRAGGLVAPIGLVRTVGALLLIGIGILKLVRPRLHPRWVGMNVGPRDLALWSFLMATAHGAGLMILPLVLGASPASGAEAHALHGPVHAPLDAAGALVSHDAAIVALHMGGMLAVMAALAIVVYLKVGLAMLRHAWVNVDLAWAAALILSGMFTLMT
jgi:hypothetical protein